MKRERLDAIVRRAVQVAVPGGLLVSQQVKLADAIAEKIDTDTRTSATDAPGLSRPRRRRGRRPPVAPRDAQTWRTVLAYLTKQRKGNVERLKAASGLIPRTVEDFDAYCGALLQRWAAEPAKAFDGLAMNDGVKQWWLLLTGAFWSFAVSAQAQWGGVSSQRVYPLRTAADSFVWWFSQEPALGKLPADLRPTARGVVGLFGQPADARDRLRLCQYARCDQLFLDESPTFRTRPAKGCTPSHSTMEGRERGRRLQSVVTRETKP